MASSFFKKGIILLIAVIMVAGLSSCKKAMLNNLKTYLSITWKISQYTKNENDSTTAFHVIRPDYQIIFGRDGNYTESFKSLNIPIAVNGSWEFLDDGARLMLTDNSTARNFEVNELKEDKLTLTLKGADTEKFYFIPK